MIDSASLEGTMSDLGKLATALDPAAPPEGLAAEKPGETPLSGEKAYEAWGEMGGDLARSLGEDSDAALGALRDPSEAAWAVERSQPLTVRGGETVLAGERAGLLFEEEGAAGECGWSEANPPVPYEHTWCIEDFDGVGDPEGAAPCWQLQEGQSCAVMAQVGVIEYVTGERLTEVEATAIAEANGWYDPWSGTLPEDCGRLLDYHDIPNEVGYDRSLEDIVQALENGEQVIVAVDAKAIWEPMRDAATGEVVFEPAGWGHAVWVTGLDVDAQGQWTVILNDTGLPDGQMRAVALEDFLAGWDEYGNLAVITEHGPLEGADVAQRAADPAL
jgi:hypothetical protein